VSYDDFDRLRRLVFERADWHLDNWGQWRRRFRVGQGFRNRSLAFSGNGVSSIEDLEDEVDSQAAHVAEGIIEGLPLQQRLVISQVYEASVWTFRAGTEALLPPAAAEFWKRAQRKGLR
jgi:hypothetical protein